MCNPSVSIIVPVYNVGPYVEDCIRSVMRQTYDGKMECIIVDDCGTDDSMAIVERLVSEYNGPIEFKILHHTHNRGLSAARNTGIDAAKGDYLFFLDSDDELTDDCMEKLAEPLRIEFYDVVVGNIRCYKLLPSGQRQVIFSPQELRKIDKDTLLCQPDILHTHRKIWGQAAWNKLYRLDFIRDNCLFFKEGLIQEDNLWGFQIACLANKLYCVNKVSYIYLKREGSITYYETENSMAECLIVILDEMCTFVENKQIKTIDTFPFFNDFFYDVMKANSTNLTYFVKTYKNVRPYVKSSIIGILYANHFSVKRCMHDFHYLMPIFIAPYWQYGIYHCLHSFLIHLKQKIWQKR